MSLVNFLLRLPYPIEKVALSWVSFCFLCPQDMTHVANRASLDRHLTDSIMKRYGTFHDPVVVEGFIDDAVSIFGVVGDVTHTVPLRQISKTMQFVLW